MDKSVVIAGSLNFLNLSEVFQLLGSSGSTGILRIRSTYSDQPGQIYFKNGSPVDAKTGSLSGLDAVYALFGWTNGEYEFSREHVENEDVVKKSRMEIVLESSKMLDNGMIKRLGEVPLKDQLIESSSTSNDVPVINGPLVDYMYVVDEEDFKDGEIIVNQGKHGNWNWVVLDGIVEVRKETPKGAVPIIRVGVGSFVGSIAGLLLQSSVRSATVVAIGDAQLGVLDSQRLAMEYTCLTSDFKEVVLSLDKRIKQVTNRAVELFLNKKSDVSKYMKGKEIFIKQGDNKEGVFTIENGHAYVIRTLKRGHILLSSLEEGDLLGSLPFLNYGHEPHSASIYTSEDFKVEPTNFERLQNEYDQLSTTFKNMIENSSNFLSATTKIVCDYKNRQEI